MAKKLTTEEFIEKANKVHNEKYDYSQVIYVNNKTKIKITCPIHGLHEQTPDSHLHSHGCYKCAKTITGDFYRYTNNSFIKKAKEVHGNKYDYSLINYINGKTKINIFCREHGLFSQSPSNHLRGDGCPYCGTKTTTLKTTSTTIKFIEKAQRVHGYTYDYSLVEYIGYKNKVKIICPTHGIFEQTPNGHLFNGGCRKCGSSIGERKISKILEDSGINYIFQKSFDSCKNKQRLRFDFYLPQFNVLIEYHGIQHFVPIKFFGGIDRFAELKRNDEYKLEWAWNNNIPLVICSYRDEWNYIKQNIFKNVNNSRNSISPIKN
jgi:hypothetical protein